MELISQPYLCTLVQLFTAFPWSLKTLSQHPLSWSSLQIALDYDCTGTPSSPILTFLFLAFQQANSTYLSKMRPDITSSVKASLTSPGRVTGSFNSTQHFVSTKPDRHPSPWYRVHSSWKTLMFNIRFNNWESETQRMYDLFRVTQLHNGRVKN